MNEKLFKKTFSRLRASEEAKREVIGMAEIDRENKRRGFSRPLRAAVVCATLALALAVTAVAANEYLGGWREGQFSDPNDPTLVRGTFEYARLVKDDTPDDPSDDMVELPHMLFGSGVQKGSGEFKVYIFLARGTETLFDKIVDVGDKLKTSPDHTFDYSYEDDNVRVSFTVTATGEKGEGYDLDHQFYIYDPASGEWMEDNGGSDATGSGKSTSAGTTCLWFNENDGIHEPVLVPITWERGPTVTDFGVDTFNHPERFENR